jgi:hypothetical protein
MDLTLNGVEKFVIDFYHISFVGSSLALRTNYDLSDSYISDLKILYAECIKHVYEVIYRSLKVSLFVEMADLISDGDWPIQNSEMETLRIVMDLSKNRNSYDDSFIRNQSYHHMMIDKMISKGSLSLHKFDYILKQRLDWTVVRDLLTINVHDITEMVQFVDSSFYLIHSSGKPCLSKISFYDRITDVLDFINIAHPWELWERSSFKTKTSRALSKILEETYEDYKYKMKNT